MTESLAINALEMALLSRQPKNQLIPHCDQGSQYKSHLFQEKLKENNIVLSMSRKGNCWDNAVVESFFKPLKNEMQNDARFASRQEARMQLFEYTPLCSNSQKPSCGFWLFFELNFFTISTDMLKKFNPKNNSKSLLHFRDFQQGGVYIEIFYNRTRLHSTLGYLSPAQYEAKQP